MKLSDIRGEKALDVLADAMELGQKLSKDKRFAELMDALRKANGDNEAMMAAFMSKVPPLLRDKAIKRGIVGVLAKANGVTAKEYSENGDVVGDLLELLLTDSESLGFFARTLSTLR